MLYNLLQDAFVEFPRLYTKELALLSEQKSSFRQERIWPPLSVSLGHSEIWFIDFWSFAHYTKYTYR